MSRSKKIPSYRLHKQSGQAVVTLTDGLGGRRDVLLGQYDTAQSRIEYTRVIAEWEATGRRLQVSSEPHSLSINELMLAFMSHAQQHYRRADGTLTHELAEYRGAFKPLRALYGTLAVSDFDPLKLKAVRQRMVDALRYRVRFTADNQARERWIWEHEFRVVSEGQSEALWEKKWQPVEVLSKKKALARSLINKRISRIVHAFKWAVSEGLGGSKEANKEIKDVYQELSTVDGLEKGRTEARETDPVQPVPEAHVLAVLPYLTPPVAAMLDLQRVTGMRPGEARVMRAVDIDMTSEVWTYRPEHHKTRHRGKDRIIHIGPRGQEIIRPFLQLDIQAYLFSPRAAIEHHHAELRAKRKTPVQPSQQDRRSRKPKRQPGTVYTMNAYGKAVAKACRKANVPHFHPHQVRHTHATEVRRQFGLEAAQVALGHSGAKITEIYAERDGALAAKVARSIG